MGKWGRGEGDIGRSDRGGLGQALRFGPAEYERYQKFGHCNCFLKIAQNIHGNNIAVFRFLELFRAGEGGGPGGSEWREPPRWIWINFWSAGGAHSRRGRKQAFP